MRKNEQPQTFKKRNYRPAIIIISTILILAIAILAGMPGQDDFNLFDITILPLMNAILNSFTFIFLIVAFVAILKRSEEHTSELQSRGHLVCRRLRVRNKM